MDGTTVRHRTRRIQISGIALVLAVTLLAACAPQAIPAPASQAPVTASAPTAPAAAATSASVAPARPAWQVEWDRIVAGAKQESTLVLYSSLGAEARQVIIKPFTSKFGVRVESVGGASSTMYPKIFAEQRAGIYSGDTWIGGSTSYVPLKGGLDSLDTMPILPDVTDPELIKKVWYFAEVPWADKDHTMLIGLMDFKEPVAINTNLVKAGEISAYRDLLDPKWKGKISLQDPRVTGNGNWWFTAVIEMRDLDVNFMRELATKQDLFITRDQLLQVDWLARGKQAIAIAPKTAAVTQFMQLGSPLKTISVGTPAVSGATSGIAMLKRPPHPNTARLFINWLLSQEGSTFLSRAVGAQSQRLDVPTDHLEASRVQKPGLKIFRTDYEEFAVKKDSSYLSLAKEVFGP